MSTHAHIEDSNKKIAFQIAIVLASASVITEIVLLAWAAAALSLAGPGFSAVGFLAPAAIHVF
ncbi:MAG: hypothetical protein HY323_13475 [Betaproteobacteria bacterium]|nr:hypothetical protein [Betaproteobacteria bacterium]